MHLRQLIAITATKITARETETGDERSSYVEWELHRVGRDRRWPLKPTRTPNVRRSL